MAQLNFNARNHPTNEFQALPNGEYLVEVATIELKMSASNTEYLAIAYRVLHVVHAKRLLFDTVTMNARNQTAVEFGQKRLSAICHATNVLDLKDTEMLIRKQLVIRVGQERHKETKALTGRNTVTGYRAARSQNTISPWDAPEPEYPPISAYNKNDLPF